MICALLSWYEESPSWLAATVSSLAPFCDYIVAVDGAYAMFPKARARSGSEQAETIIEVADAAGIGAITYSPTKPWAGNEVEKRGKMFKLAEQVTTADDWYFVIDGDEVVRHVPADFADKLTRADLDVGEVALWERTDVLADRSTALAAQTFVWDAESTTPMRMFFRALRGLQPVGNHYTYATPEGRVLWGDAASKAREPAWRESGFIVEHRHQMRPQARRKAARDYYSARDECKVERGPCWQCASDDPSRAEHPAFVNWRRVDGELEADPVLVCGDCISSVEATARRQIDGLGADPDRLVRGTV